MKEIWKDIPEYEGLYKASNLGRIKAVNYRGSGEDRVFRGTPKKSGYVPACLTKNGKEKHPMTHRLVTGAFIGEIPEGMEVNHKNGIKSDNRLENLEYCTKSENQLHAINTLGFKSWLTIRNPNKGKKGKDCKHSKCVGKYDTNNNLLETYSSILEGANAIGVVGSAITLVLKGKHKTSGGFIWKYV